MKAFPIILLIVLFLPLRGTAQEETPVLLGPITVEQLLDLPGWFGEEFLTYRPEAEYMTQIPDYSEDVTIVCVLATWCSDSRREVPRMLRLMQLTNIPPERMQMIGVDRSKESPDGEAAQYDIERVPTFIFFRDGKEIGRIVESPIATLERDMLGILMNPVGGNPPAGQDDEDTAPSGSEAPAEGETDSARKQGSGALHHPSGEQDKR